ncbi:hypothetical protein BJY01DRAFT_204558 [Aspergillus pseudoustus]|uniref:Uncharacterized protein n=1 Tax=Aspergillus pseudoustus TaxID=1810923 RepID=A0ABR4KSX6_9EURO
MDDPRSWKSAIAQLLISLFPNEFLPEILGFNMHYELISLEVMIAARELKEIGVDPLYFLLHVCIDNADSGHTAMALLNVIDYLDIVKETGREDLQEQWKRVQAGYILSQTLVVSCDGPDNPTYTGEGTSVYPLTAQVISIFKSKTSVSQKYHCQSKARIGSRTLAEWLDPQLWDHDETQKHLELLSALSRSKRWISPGRGRQSRLVQELTWGGRMFGAFTSDEVDVLAAWIDALGFGNKSSTDISPYYTFTGRKPVASRDVVRSLQDPAVHHPVAARASTVKTTILATTPTIIPCFSLDNEQPLNAPSQANIPDVVSLWFAHIGLLENTINVPCRTATSLHSNILLILRAQAGFARETDIPAGTAEMLLPSRDLVRIGLEIVARAGWPDASNPGSSPSCLKEVFTLTRDKGQGEDRAGLAYDMLTWANAPEENLSFLVGLAVAFLGLKEAVRMSGLLGEDSQVGLGMIVQRERKALVRCMVEIVGMGNKHSSELERGYWIGRSALEECLGVKQKDSFLRKVSSLAPRTALPDPHPSSQA